VITSLRSVKLAEAVSNTAVPLPGLPLAGTARICRLARISGSLFMAARPRRTVGRSGIARCVRSRTVPFWRDPVMRRTLLIAPVLGAVLVGAAVFPRLPRSSTADPSKTEPAARANPVLLPVSQVVLFSSGVGYLQREGTVEGSARIDLTFPVSDINDLLKSMVLQDLGGGHISA